MRPQLPEDDAPRSVERFREAGADSMVVDAKQAVVAIDRLLAANSEPEDSEPVGQASPSDGASLEEIRCRLRRGRASPSRSTVRSAPASYRPSAARRS